MDVVTGPTDYYPYHYNSVDATVTLIGVPSDREVIDFTNLAIEELPREADIDYIAADTFAGCQVKTVKFTEKLKGIESGIFNGITGDLTVEFTGKDPVELNNWTSDNPFTFGMAEDKLHIKVPEGAEQDYIDEWSCVFAGYENMAALQRNIATQLQEKLQREPSDEEIGLAVKKCLLPAQNRLRRMMGLDPLDESILSEDLQEAADQEEPEMENPEKEDPEAEETEEADPSPDEEETGDKDGSDGTKELENGKDSNDTEDADDTQNPDGSKDSEDPENKDSQDLSGNDTKVEDTVL